MSEWKVSTGLPFIKIGSTIISVEDIVCVGEGKDSTAIVHTRDGRTIHVQATPEQIWETLRPTKIDSL